MRHIKGLRINWETGEGKVVLPPEFKREDTLFRMDVLKDWREYICEAYAEACKEHREEFEKIRTKVKP